MPVPPGQDAEPASVSEDVDLVLLQQQLYGRDIADMNWSNREIHPRSPIPLEIFIFIRNVVVDEKNIYLINGYQTENITIPRK